MKLIRQIVSNNKSIFAFSLIFVFVYAGIFRNAVIGSASANTYSIQYTQKQNSPKFLSTKITSPGKLSLVDEMNKTDKDLGDLEFDAVDFSDSTGLNLFFKRSKFTSHQLEALHSQLTLPLYDLFCKWKFHLL